MSRSAADVLPRLQRQRSDILQGYLWIFLAVVVGTFCVNVLLLGPRVLAPSSLVPNLLFVFVVGAALWLNGRHRFRAAVTLLAVVILLAAAFPLFTLGVAASGMNLFLLFLPVVLVGLTLDRRALYLTAGASLLTALLAPVVQGADFVLSEPDLGDDAWPVVFQFSVILATVVFFLDRFGLTFQATLRTAVERGAAFDREVSDHLKTNEERLEEKRFNEAIIENLPGIFYVIDESGRYFKWNRNLAEVIGYDEAELESLDPLDLFEGTEKDVVAGRMAEVFTAGRAATEATLVTKDGERIPYFLNGTRITRGGTTYLAGIGIDRSDLDAAQARIRALNEELQDRLERITSLHEIDKAITGSLDLDLTLEVVLEQVTQRLRVDAACILLHDPRSQTLRYGASRGFRSDALRGIHLEMGEGLAGHACLHRERVFVDDPEELANRLARAAQVEGEGFESFVAVPLVAKGQLQGVLELFHRGRLPRDDDWDDFLTTLATQAAIALDGARMVENLERSNQELRRAYDTTIEGWARALDLKDEETEGHSRRVTELTMRLARHVGMRDEDLEHVRRGALLHDIGKMGIPDRILLKPGKLDTEEWEAMKRHTTYAFELLSPVPFLREALDIPYCHHERWDGTGYPRGLKGSQIPLSARLFAIVDVYDALTSDRPYRAAWSEARALEHIRDGAGSHFDPDVVDMFLELIEARRTPAR